MTGAAAAPTAPAARARQAPCSWCCRPSTRPESIGARRAPRCDTPARRRPARRRRRVDRPHRRDRAGRRGPGHVAAVQPRGRRGDARRVPVRPRGGLRLRRAGRRRRAARPGGHRPAARGARATPTSWSVPGSPGVGEYVVRGPRRWAMRLLAATLSSVGRHAADGPDLGIPHGERAGAVAVRVRLPGGVPRRHGGGPRPRRAGPAAHRPGARGDARAHRRGPESERRALGPRTCCGSSRRSCSPSRAAPRSCGRGRPSRPRAVEMARLTIVTSSWRSLAFVLVFELLRRRRLRQKYAVPLGPRRRGDRGARRSSPSLLRARRHCSASRCRAICCSSSRC